MHTTLDAAKLAMHGQSLVQQVDVALEQLRILLQRLHYGRVRASWKGRSGGAEFDGSLLRRAWRQLHTLPCRECSLTCRASGVVLRGGSVREGLFT